MKLHQTQQARLSPFASQNRQTQKKPRRVLLRQGVRRAPLCHILNDAAELKIIKGCVGSKGRLAKPKRENGLAQNEQGPGADNGTPRGRYANGPGQITIRLGPSQNKILRYFSYFSTERGS